MILIQIVVTQTPARSELLIITDSIFTSSAGTKPEDVMMKCQTARQAPGPGTWIVSCNLVGNVVPSRLFRNNRSWKSGHHGSMVIYLSPSTIHRRGIQKCVSSVASRIRRPLSLLPLTTKLLVALDDEHPVAFALARHGT